MKEKVFTLLIAFRDRFVSDCICDINKRGYLAHFKFEVIGIDEIPDILNRQNRPDVLLLDSEAFNMIASKSSIENLCLSTHVIVYLHDTYQFYKHINQSLISHISTIPNGLRINDFMEYLQLVIKAQMPIQLLNGRDRASSNDEIVLHNPIKQHELYKLTSREIDVWKLLLTMKTEKQIAEILHISLFTVRKHKSNISQKIGIKNKYRLSVYILQQSA